MSAIGITLILELGVYTKKNKFFVLENKLFYSPDQTRTKVFGKTNEKNSLR